MRRDTIPVVWAAGDVAFWIGEDKPDSWRDFQQGFIIKA
jgi:hypothetical protein